MERQYSMRATFTVFGDKTPLIELSDSMASALALGREMYNGIDTVDWFPGIFMEPNFTDGALLPDTELRLFIQDAGNDAGNLSVVYVGYGTTGEKFIQCVCDTMGLSCILSSLDLMGNEKILLPQGAASIYRLRKFTDISGSRGLRDVKNMNLERSPENNANLLLRYARDLLDSAGYLMSTVLATNSRIHDLTLALAVSESRKHFMSWYNNYMLSAGLPKEISQAIVRSVHSLDSLGDIYVFNMDTPECSDPRRLLRAMLILHRALDYLQVDSLFRDWVQQADQIEAVLL